MPPQGCVLPLLVTRYELTRRSCFAGAIYRHTHKKRINGALWNLYNGINIMAYSPRATITTTPRSLHVGATGSSYWTLTARNSSATHMGNSTRPNLCTQTRDTAACDIASFYCKWHCSCGYYSPQFKFENIFRKG